MFALSNIFENLTILKNSFFYFLVEKLLKKLNQHFILMTGVFMLEKKIKRKN